MNPQWIQGEDSSKRSFTVVVERDPEGGWLAGKVVELPGCHSQTPDLRTIETNTQEAICAYLKTVGPDEHARITVKIVDYRSIESLKVVEVE